MSADITHCAALVRAADRDCYLATLFAPAERREALFALYAFNVEIARVRDLAREPMPGQIRLQWWREVLAGARDGEAAAHPVAAALQDALSRHAIGPEKLIGLIDARAFDLYAQPMATLDDLDTYTMHTEGAIFAVAARILGTEADTLARHAGLACGIAGILAAFGRHAARGRLFVPTEVFERHGVDAAGVLGGKAESGLQAALDELRRHALRHLDAAAAELPSLPARALPAFLPAALARPLLARLGGEHDPFEPARLSGLWRQWLIWRAARHPQRLFG